jgi:hypothetical protein
MLLIALCVVVVIAGCLGFAYGRRKGHFRRWPWSPKIVPPPAVVVPPPRRGVWRNGPADDDAPGYALSPLEGELSLGRGRKTDSEQVETTSADVGSLNVNMTGENDKAGLPPYLPPVRPPAAAQTREGKQRR